MVKKPLLFGFPLFLGVVAAVFFIYTISKVDKDSPESFGTSSEGKGGGNIHSDEGEEINYANNDFSNVASAQQPDSWEVRTVNYLSADDELSVATVIASIEKSPGLGEHVGKFEETLANEDTDPRWSDSAKYSIDDSLLAVANKVNDIRVSSAQCTASICALYAVGSDSTQGSTSDWQAVIREISNRDWWKENFDDAVVTISVDPDRKQLVHLTYFIRSNK